MMASYPILLACYRSDQMTEACWQDHLSADPLLALWYARKTKKENIK